eukprot:scaffold200455_cov30-Tisochrysis_lutea.AAC.2
MARSQQHAMRWRAERASSDSERMPATANMKKPKVAMMYTATEWVRANGQCSTRRAAAVSKEASHTRRNMTPATMLRLRRSGSDSARLRAAASTGSGMSTKANQNNAGNMMRSSMMPERGVQTER